MKTTRLITIAVLSAIIAGCASTSINKVDVVQVQTAQTRGIVTEVAATSLAYYYRRGVSKEPVAVYLDVKDADWQAVLALANIRRPMGSFKGLNDNVELRDGVLWEKGAGQGCLFLQIKVKIVSEAAAEAAVYSSDLGWHISLLYKLRKSDGDWRVVEVLHGGDT